ncbi:hypothetical protein SEPCBS57363_001211 [Sporothrix epigloea]|uniref:Cell cycle control protein n=1 Tax=Sporothrix epigloea TaxID=1892477 RepID=A0ABP0D8Y8_9PEZI
MSRPQRGEPNIIDLTEEPDSPVFQAQSNTRTGASRGATRSAATAAQSSTGQRQSASTVIDLTGDDEPSNFLRRAENRQRRQDAYSRTPVHEVRDQQRNASRSIFSAFNIGNIAHLSSLALGTATGSGNDNIGNSSIDNSIYNNEMVPGRRVVSAHRQHRSAVRAHNYRVQQAQHAADRHLLNLAEAQIAMALHSRNPRRRGVPGSGPGHGFGHAHGHGSGLYEDMDELQILQAAGLNPLSDDALHLDYRQNGGVVFPGFGPADVWRSTGYGNNSGARYEAPTEPLPGYTRETGEDLVAVCASCDRELAYDPEEGEGGGAGTDGQPSAKRTRKTAKDSAQHHFWAVRTCGHVYCSACYEGRRYGMKKDAKSNQALRGENGSGSISAPSVMFVVDGKTIYCAAEGCHTDVTAKSKWQGLFV